MGRHAGVSITTGGGNTFIGEEAGDTCTSGYANVVVGENSDLDTSGRIGATAIGPAVTTYAANWSTMIKSDGGIYNTGNTSSFNTTSDSRIKKDIVDNTQGLEVINKIRVCNFKYRTAEEIDAPELQEYDLKNLAVSNTKLQIGAIAQEIEEVLPDTVTYSDWGVRDINTDPLVWHLVNAVKELSAEVEQLKSQINN